MAKLDLERIIKKGVEEALNKPIMDGKSIMEWAAIGMKAPQWISVKDRLPEKSGQYLCWFGANKFLIGSAIETYVDEWKAFVRLESLEKYPNITHWMPLPEPPEEVSGDD